MRSLCFPCAINGVIINKKKRKGNTKKNKLSNNDANKKTSYINDVIIDKIQIENQ